jgi:hypothetical protein
VRSYTLPAWDGAIQTPSDRNNAPAMMRLQLPHDLVTDLARPPTRGPKFTALDFPHPPSQKCVCNLERVPSGSSLPNTATGRVVARPFGYALYTGSHPYLLF